MLFVCGIIVVVCCIFRSILLLLPTTCIESDADEGGGHRFTLIDDYYHDPDDFTKSFAWLLVYYLSGEVVPCFVQVITYHWLPSSSSRFENKGIPLAEKEIVSQNTHAAENVVRKLLQGEVHSSITSIPWEEIILGPKIGTGAAGIVYQAKFRGLRVAVKQIEVDLRASMGDHQELRSFCQEISIMAKLRHPNICQFIGVSLTRNLGDESVPFNIALIMEFVELGSLSDVLKKQRDLSFDKRMRIAREIALGMNYLHCNNPTVLHRDFKASNIFITSDLHAKIGDFGFSSLRRDAFSFSGSQNFMTSLSIEDVSEFGGTLEYMAPELLALPGANKIHYTPKCDVYSYGVVLWELATQLELFAGMEKGEIITFVVDRKARLPIPPSVPSQIRNLISACWHHDPNNRPKFQQILTDLTNFLGM
ncbi:Serine/threonine-protein kinase CTR1 [Pelomyxa schiedti]|nr:Serine/threonine-protein kinase CTR1 [Pelomyxa schiedti]